ncbi:dihydroorotase [Petroclostridium xylanilyticum]|uniref:dihydroorotase n=1 Tax=Petroclostridium xylanilyticum TaxID=1792311 RepID=UPI000B98703D|nr:dihydroorotase [Petroclostridium xylanilyticum]
MRILIKNGHVIDPKNRRDDKLDIYIENGLIVEIDKELDYSGGDIEVIDAEGKLVVPGLIDMHCHLREPGYEYKEDIESGTRSAAVGGFTSIACMPNTNPVIDNQAIVEYVKTKAKNVGVVNVYPIGAITKGLKGEELAEIGELKFAGVVAVSDDGKPVMNSSLMRRALQYANMFDTPVISHCEDLTLVGDGVMNEGYMSTYLGLKGITRAAEDVMVARDIVLSEVTGTPIHIAHVSTAGAVEIIRHAKARGVKVTCETCPHYFTLTDKAVEGYNTAAKMNPPLRTEEDVEAVKEGLKDGTIDVIATDHAPHHIDEKNVEFDKAANGIVGFETALALGITYLVDTGILTMSQLLQKMCVNPANILGLNKGSLGINRPADVIVIDKNEEYIVDINKFQSKSRNSPYHGYTLKGTVHYTIVGGKVIVRQKVLL